jgi:hypothetical protein
MPQHPGELSFILNVNENEINSGLKQLEDNHGLLLHPHSYDK